MKKVTTFVGAGGSINDPKTDNPYGFVFKTKKLS